MESPKRETTHQVFVKMLDGNHRALNFAAAAEISVAAVKRRIESLTSIPSHLQLLLSPNSRILHDHQTLISPNCEFDRIEGFNEVGLGRNLVGCDGFFEFPVFVSLLLRLRGGKGGFGSLLRGAATKAGQKKTNNFDACRDMSGRRLRHVNAEKKLEEWRAEAEERRLEKMAEEFIKKKAKENARSGKGNGNDGAEKYVAKYREDSAKCMEEVERSVRESVKGLMGSKRKSGAEGSDSAAKRLKIWLGKRKFGDSDSEDLDEDDSDEEEEEEKENEKSVIIDNGSHSDSGKETEASSGSITGGKLDDGSPDQGSSGSGSEKEDTVSEKPLQSDGILDGNSQGRDTKPLYKPDRLEKNTENNGAAMKLPHRSHSSEMEVVVSEQPGISISEDEVAPAAEVGNNLTLEPVLEESVPVSENLQNLDTPLNFDDYQSASELEVLGMEHLKTELQARGLKCGGTLQERAARLFLLKTTPIEKLPKKLFAKK